MFESPGIESLMEQGGNFGSRRYLERCQTKDHEEEDEKGTATAANASTQNSTRGLARA